MSAVVVVGATGLLFGPSRGETSALASFSILAGCPLTGALQKELSPNLFPALAVQMVSMWVQ